MGRQAAGQISEPGWGTGSGKSNGFTAVLSGNLLLLNEGSCWENVFLAPGSREAPASSRQILRAWEEVGGFTDDFPLRRK